MATQSSAECGRSAENSENDGGQAGAGGESGTWDPNMLVGKLSPRDHFPSATTWRTDGFLLFGKAATNCGDNSDPTTNATDQVTTQSADFSSN